MTKECGTGAASGVRMADFPPVEMRGGAQASPEPAPCVKFVNHAMSADIYQIEAGELAAGRGGVRVREVARILTGAHRQNSQRLLSTLRTSQADFAAPETLSARHGRMLDDLRLAPEGEFDNRFLVQQAGMLEETLDLYRSFVEGGKNEALRSFARMAVPALSHHLEYVRELLSGR